MNSKFGSFSNWVTENQAFLMKIVDLNLFCKMQSYIEISEEERERVNERKLLLDSGFVFVFVFVY